VSLSLTDVAALRAYLPRCLLRLIQQQRPRLRSHAAALFVDISGFTAMTEAFAVRGNAGAEELTANINHFFTALIAVVDEYGGDIVAFGGDAMAVAFVGPPSRAKSLLRRAYACALALQHAARQSAQVQTSLGPFTLSIKLGLAYGSFVGEIIRASPTQARFLVYGSALQFAGDAEHSATLGHLALHPSVAPFEPQPHPPSTRSPRLHPLIPLPPHLINLSDYAHFLPPALVTRLLSGQGAYVNEHRHISIMFVGVDRIADMPTVMALIEQWGGAVTRLDSGDKGLRVLALFGAPIAYEDNAARATRCAMAIQDRLGVQSRMGLSSGSVFCGEVGAPSRHEYTVMGDAVNIAARLMQAAAWGETLATESTRTAAADHAHWQARSALTLKGKAEPVPVFVPLPIENVTPSTSPTTPLHSQPIHGRAREIAQINTLLDGLATTSPVDKPFALHIVAEAGMGKSLLAAHVATQAHQRGYAIALAAGQPYGQAVFGVWRQLLRTIMGLPALDNNITAIAQQWLAAHAPHLQLRWPLLAQTLGWVGPNEAWLGTIDAETRTSLLHETVSDLLRAGSRQQITVFIIDDAHWLDAASRDLLAFVVAQRGDAPWGCLLFSRPEPAPMADSALMPQMTLGEIDESEALALAQRTWMDMNGGAGLAPAPDSMSTPHVAVNSWAGASPAPPETVLRDIVQRGQGNPFFIEQLVRLARQSTANAGQSLMTLPTSLRNLWLHRIDQLPAEAQTALKLASVIGPSFGVDWLRACWPGDHPINADALIAQLNDLVQFDYLRVSPAPSAITHTFRHATLREAAYDTLSFANRASLHEQVGFFIEQRFAAQRNDHIDSLAHHFGLSKNIAKQRNAFREAGDAASQRFANEAALNYYARLLPILEGDAQVPVLLQMGEVELHVGHWSQAEAHLQQALHQASADTMLLEQAQAQALLGRLLARSQSYGESAKWLTQASALFEILGEQIQLCKVLTHLGFAQMELGDLSAAEATAQRQWQLAQSIHDPAGMAEAQQTLGQLATQRGDWSTAHTHLEEALALANAQLDPRRIMLIENDVATLAWHIGDYGAAFQHFVAALQSADRIGFRTWVGVLLGNLGVLFWELGLLDRSEALLACALKIAIDLGDKTSILTSLGNIAPLLHDQGDAAKAQAVLAQAVQMGQDLHMPYYLCDHAALAAELALAGGDVDAAARLNAIAIEAAESAADEAVAFRARVLGLRIALRKGLYAADEVVAQLHHWLADETDDEHIALLRDHLAQLTQRDEDKRAAVLAYTYLHQKIPKLQYRRRVQALSILRPALPIPNWVQELQAQPLPELTTLVVGAVPLKVFDSGDEGPRGFPSSPFVS